MVATIPQVTNWSVTPQNGQVGYFTLMNTWLFESTTVINSLNTAITKINEAGEDINNIGQNAINAITFDNIAQLKLNSNMGRVDILGYYTKGDGGGGLFYWDSASTETDNGGTIIQATGVTTGRWKRAGYNVLSNTNIRLFGAKEGDFDNTSIIQYVLDTYLKADIPSGTFIVKGTITMPIGSVIQGVSKEVSIIKHKPLTDIDCFVVGWYSTIEDLTIESDFDIYNIGTYTKGLIRLQNTTYSEIPTVGGIDWKLHGGLSYKNTLRNLIVKKGQNYNIYGVNLGYTLIENVRSVLSRNTAGNLYITGTNDGVANIPSTTVTVKGGEYTSSYKGSGIRLEKTVQSKLDSVITEGNFSRGITIDYGSSIELEKVYVENNFALGATIGDGDIVVTNSERVSIDNSFIYSNNSNASLASSTSSKCSLANTEYTNGLVPWVLNVVNSQWTIARQGNGIFDYGEYTLAAANGTFENKSYWVKYADGTAIFTKRITLSARNISTAQGNIFIQGTNEVDTDIPSDLFRINNDSSLEFCASILSMYGSGGNAIWAVSNGTSTLNNALRYRLASNVSLTGVNIPLQITLTGRWR